MHRIRAYVDTSVFGGTQDDEFAEPSRRFFSRVHQGEFAVLLSTVTFRKLMKAPEAVRAVLRALPRSAVEEVRIDVEVKQLAREYIRAGALTESSEADALHVAAATVAGADLILSWNFRHIVNLKRILRYNSVNERGFGLSFDDDPEPIRGKL